MRSASSTLAGYRFPREVIAVAVRSRRRRRGPQDGHGLSVPDPNQPSSTKQLPVTCIRAPEILYRAAAQRSRRETRTTCSVHLAPGPADGLPPALTRTAGNGEWPTESLRATGNAARPRPASHHPRPRDASPAPGYCPSTIGSATDGFTSESTCRQRSLSPSVVGREEPDIMARVGVGAAHGKKLRDVLQSAASAGHQRQPGQ